MIWVNTMLPFDDPSNPPGNATSSSKMTRVQVKAQKIRALKLCLSFVIAVKHHLRDEYETDYDDFVDVLPADLFGKKRDPLISSLAGMTMTNSKSSWTSNPPRETSPLIGQSQTMPERYGEYNDEKKYPFPLM
jgi:putative membrane protein